MKKALFLFTVLSIMVVSGFFGRSLMQVMAEEEESIYYDKYYTSIQLEEGDTLWSIEEEYGVNSGKSTEEYIHELRKMNSLCNDTIHAGNYLTVCYYAPEEESGH